MTDETKLVHIFKNLFDNAIKFTNQGYIETGYTIKDDYIEFYVKDTGIGISAINYEKIFQPFRQAEINTSVSYGGTGMGLSITKSYINMLGGKIWLQSRLHEGTTFYFTVSLATNKVLENQIKAPAKHRLNATNTCLIVEDFEINYQYLKALIAPLGVTVLWAKNGKEALEIISENPDINFVLMDIRLPDINGYQLTRIIKAAKPQLPVIAQTANALVNEKEMAFEAGCTDYITKPIYRDELLKKISCYIH